MGVKGARPNLSIKRFRRKNVFLGQGLVKDTPERVGVWSDKVVECCAYLCYSKAF